MARISSSSKNTPLLNLQRKTQHTWPENIYFQSASSAKPMDLKKFLTVSTCPFTTAPKSASSVKTAPANPLYSASWRERTKSTTVAPNRLKAPASGGCPRNRNSMPTKRYGNRSRKPSVTLRRCSTSSTKFPPAWPTPCPTTKWKKPWKKWDVYRMPSMLPTVGSWTGRSTWPWMRWFCRLTTRTPALFPAGRRVASLCAASCSRNRTSFCSTSRPTTSTPKRCSGWRTSSATIPAT